MEESRKAQTLAGQYNTQNPKASTKQDMLKPGAKQEQPKKASGFEGAMLRYKQENEDES